MIEKKSDLKTDGNSSHSFYASSDENAVLAYVKCYHKTRKLRLDQVESCTVSL